MLYFACVSQIELGQAIDQGETIAAVATSASTDTVVTPEGRNEVPGFDLSIRPLG